MTLPPFLIRFSAVLSLLCQFCTYSSGQNGNYQMGARSTGMGGASIAVSDAWSLFNNPAGVAEVETSNVLFGYQNRYSIASLSNLGLGFIHPTAVGHLGLSAFRFGDELFSEQKIAATFSNRIGIVALGATLNYVQFRIEGLGTRSFPTFDFGGIVSFREKLKIGAYISNINQGRVSKVEDEQLPTIMRLGFSYRPLKSLYLNAEVEKDLDFDEILKVGIEYNFYKKLFVRTGIQTQPFQSRFGIGFQPNRVSLDYAFGDNPTLGNLHEVSVGYSLKK